MISEFRFGDPAIPKEEEPEEDGIENVGERMYPIEAVVSAVREGGQGRRVTLSLLSSRKETSIAVYHFAARCITMTSAARRLNAARIDPCAGSSRWTCSFGPGPAPTTSASRGKHYTEIYGSTKVVDLYLEL